MSEHTAADRIERQLTLAILRGTLPPSSRLPPVRELARQHGVNPNTVQRALAALGATGLVSARQGSGVRVNDPHLVGDLSLIPAWLAALEPDPPAAARVLADFLEVRRVLASRLLVRHRERLLAELPALAQRAATVLDAPDLDAVERADFGFAREVLRAAGNTVAVAVLNTAARMLDEVPAVRAAMYAVPHENAASIGEILKLLAADLPDAERAEQIEIAIAAVDERTVARFLTPPEAE